MKYSNEIVVAGKVVGVCMEEMPDGPDLRFVVETVSGLPDILSQVVCIYPAMPGADIPQLEKGMWVKAKGTLRMDTWKNGKPRTYAITGEPEIITAEQEKKMINHIFLQGCLDEPIEPVYKIEGIKGSYTVYAKDALSQEIYCDYCAVPEDKAFDIGELENLKGPVITVGSVWVWHDFDTLASMPVIVMKRLDIDEYAAMSELTDWMIERGAHGILGLSDEGHLSVEEF